MTRVLLAGGTGALGREVNRLLAAEGYDVVRLVRGNRKGSDRLADLRWPDSLRGTCDGIDAVISCAGASMCLRAFRDRSTFRDVDWVGNRNLLLAARAAGVGKFVYVSLAGGPQLRSTEYARCHEEFVTDLRDSGIDYTVVRPTALYSFLGEIFRMAQQGIGVVVGNGEARTNPIHPSDAARACIEGLAHGVRDVEVGGPAVYTRRQLVETAFGTLGRRPKMLRAPEWAMPVAAGLLRPFQPRIAALLEFGNLVSLRDCLAPAYGTLRLEDYFRHMAGLHAAAHGAG